MAFEVKLKGNSEGIFSRQIVQKGLSNIYIYVCVLYWSFVITICIWTKSCQSAVETPTLRTSQDITTHIYIYIIL